MEKQVEMAEKEVEELTTKVEDIDAIAQTQAETTRKREFELSKVRKELDEQQAMYEAQLQQLKKKQQDHITELTDQLDAAQRNKLKLVPFLP